MPLDPQAKSLIERAVAAGLPPYSALGHIEARRVMPERTAQLQGKREPVADVEDRRIPSPGGELRIRLYTPAGDGPFPLLVYFHGGGFVLGNLDSHDVLCRAITNAGDCMVASVDYRLAPEHKFPAAAEDAYAATKWLSTHAAELNADPHRIAVGGDSAGGALAAVAALVARDLETPALAYQLLLYPVTNHSFDTASYRDNGSGYMLSRADMEWYWSLYLARNEDGRNPYASPLRAKGLHGLPPALVITAEYDPLRDEGEAYAARLREAGVSVTHTRYDGMIHGFLRMNGVLDQANRAIEQVGKALRETLR